VRLAAAEAAVDEAPVLLAAVEDLLHVVEDAGQLLLDGRGDDVVVDELLDLVGAGSASRSLTTKPIARMSSRASVMVVAAPESSKASV
jgi:hypothetical protein